MSEWTEPRKVNYKSHIDMEDAQRRIVEDLKFQTRSADGRWLHV
jgi:hypothetical protein